MTTPIPFKGPDIPSVEFSPFTVATLTNGMEVYLLDYMSLTDQYVTVKPGDGWFSRSYSKGSPFYSYAFDSGHTMGLTPFIRTRIVRRENHVRVGFFSKSNSKVNFKFLSIPAESVCPNNYMLPDTIPEDILKYSTGWKSLQDNDWLNPDAYYFLIEGERAPVQIFDSPSAGTLNVLYADNLGIARTCKIPEEAVVAFFSEEDEASIVSPPSKDSPHNCPDPTPIPTPLMRAIRKNACVNTNKD